jgi:hypothetical protein
MARDVPDVKETFGDMPDVGDAIEEVIVAANWLHGRRTGSVYSPSATFACG